MKKALVLAAALTSTSFVGANGVNAEELKSGLSVRTGDIGESTSLSGFVFKPLTSREDGSIFYVDAYGSIIFDNSFDSDISAALSSRIGFRSKKENGLGFNVGLDVTPYGDETFAQIGFGAEYFTENLKLDLTASIPFEEGDFENYASGFISGGKLRVNSQSSKSTLSNYQLRGEYKLSDSTSLIAKAYALDPLKDDYDTEFGFGAGAKVSKGNTSLTVEYSYDEIFDSAVSANLSISLGGNSGGRKGSNERFLAHRSGQVKVGEVKRTFTATDAIDSSSLKSVEALCIGSLGGSNSCSTTLNSDAISSNTDYILVANGTITDLDLETTVADTLKIGANTTLTSVAEAPNIKTTLGTVKLSKFGSTSGAKPKFKDGSLSIDGKSSVKGFDFENSSITSDSTSDITIANNNFTGSINGQGAIVLDGATDVVIEGNIITNPGTSALVGDANGSLIGRGIAVKNGNNIRITDNAVKGATAEGIYIENIGTNSNNLLSKNIVSDMRVGVDTNLEAGIFVRNNKDGYIAITGNTVKDNNHTSGIGYPTSRDDRNAADGIEVNICRGGVNLGSDGFTDGVAGACGSNSTLTAVINNNIVSNLQGAADGIDSNIGDNGRLNITVTGNTVTGAGDEGFTLDAFGANTEATVVVTDNTLKTSGAKGSLPGEDGSTDGIAITLQENVTDTNFTASGDYNFTITGNTIEADTDNLASTVESGDKAEGIKFTVGEKLKAGNLKVTALIDNNNVTTRVGDGIEFDTLTEAEGTANVTYDVTISNNTVTQTNNATGAGAPDDKVKDLINIYFSENEDNQAATDNTYVTGKFTFNNNTLKTNDGNIAKNNAIEIKGVGSSANTSVDVNVKNQIQDQTVKVSKVNGQIFADTVTNLEIAENTITNPETSLLKGSSTVSYIGRGIDVRNSDKIKIENNTITGATAEGIYLENVGTSTSNTIKDNTITGMKASTDSNLEAGIFVRNNKDGYIAITGNTVKDNNQTAGIGYPTSRDDQNAVDGIEVNVCRGGTNLGSDGFTDGVAGACESNSTLTAVINNNIVSNLQGAADGIDSNIGDNGRLNITVTGNTVTGAGDEGFTLDAFGANTEATVVVTDNTLKTSGAKGSLPGEDGSTDGIAITLQENVTDTNFKASGVYNFTITGNTIEADTDNLAGTVEQAEKAEGIKFTIDEGVKRGTTKVTALIENNDIKTRIGDGIEFAVNEKAGNGVVFDANITINNNRIVQTNDNPVGSNNSDPKDIIKATFGEDGEGSITKGTFTITNNTVTSAAGAGDAFDYESLSTSNSNSFKFKIEGNNFSAADDQDVKIAIPAGFLGIFSPDGTTNFNTYLDSINTDSEASISGSPVVFRF